MQNGARYQAVLEILTEVFKDFSNVNIKWVLNQKSIAIMSGASTSSEVVEEIYKKLKKY